MTDNGFQRAYSPERKRQRHDDLLQAARRLARDYGVRDVTLTAIAAAAGLHKSAVLRYFETREALFLVLTAEGWQDWVSACLAGMGAAAGDPQAVAGVMARTLAGRPLFCDLLGQAPMNLEREVSPEGIRDFKLAVLEQVEILSAGIAGALPPLTAGQGRQAVSMVTGLAGALWQISHPVSAVAELYAAEPRLAHAAVDFEPTLQSDAEVIIEGIHRVATAAPLPVTIRENGPLAANSRASGPFLLCLAVCHLVALQAVIWRCPRTGRADGFPVWRASLGSLSSPFTHLGYLPLDPGAGSDPS